MVIISVPVYCDGSTIIAVTPRSSAQLFSLLTSELLWFPKIYSENGSIYLKLCLTAPWSCVWFYVNHCWIFSSPSVYIRGIEEKHVKQLSQKELFYIWTIIPRGCLCSSSSSYSPDRRHRDSFFSSSVPFESSIVWSGVMENSVDESIPGYIH